MTKTRGQALGSAPLNATSLLHVRRLRRFPLMLISVFYACVSLAQVPANGHRSHTEAVLKLQRYRTRWVISAVVGGRARQYLLDTGGGLTLISDKTAKEAGCTPWGRLTGFNMFAKRIDSQRCDNIGLDIGAVHFQVPIVGLIDMGKLNAKDAELDGIIALDLFAGRAITLELDEGRLTIESQESLKDRVSSMTPLPIALTREMQGHSLSISAGVPTKNGLLWMELDSGNGGTILVSKPVAPLLGLNPASDARQRADFSVAGDIRAVSEDAFTADIILDGNLGMPFLRTCKITLDLKSGKGWIASAKSLKDAESQTTVRP